MSHTYDVTVVLSTYNRAAMLARALESLVAQAEPLPSYEVIVVDNNSTDETATVAAQYTAGGPVPVRYLFERRQGLSHARNAGIDAARADIVAFTDDDVRVSRQWVQAIRDTFAAWPEVQCLGGRTLPVWPSPPPSWLTTRHWVGPLALQDYGDAPMIIDARRPLCLAGANFAFRKHIFDRIGRFSIEFPRGQDTELLLRLYQAGYQSLYVPQMLVHATVTPERLTKAYHRHWHTNVGRCNARMRFQELADPVLGLRREVPQMRRIFGIPTFALRQIAGEAWMWLLDTTRGHEAEAFLHESRARALLSYMREARTLGAPPIDASPIATPRSEP